MIVRNWHVCLIPGCKAKDPWITRVRTVTTGLFAIPQVTTLPKCLPPELKMDLIHLKLVEQVALAIKKEVIKKPTIRLWWPMWVLQCNADWSAFLDDYSFQDSYQRQPLLTPQPDSCSSDDELGANSSGYTRRKSKHPKPDSTRIDMTGKLILCTTVGWINWNSVKCALGQQTLVYCTYIWYQVTFYPGWMETFELKKYLFKLRSTSC